MISPIITVEPTAELEDTSEEETLHIRTVLFRAPSYPVQLSSCLTQTISGPIEFLIHLFEQAVMHFKLFVDL